MSFYNHFSAQSSSELALIGEGFPGLANPWAEQAIQGGGQKSWKAIPSEIKI